MKVKTIDIIAKEWFDRINGNSYHAGEVTVNFGMDDEKTFFFPFQYGYGSSYEDSAKELLVKNGIMPKETLWRWCEDNDVILRSNITRGCKKRELKQYDVN